jgi:HK97 family phage major capsid protein
MLTPAAIREIYKLQHEADSILNQRTVTRADGKRVDGLLAKIASIRASGMSGTEVRQHLANELGREMGRAPVEFDSLTPEQRAHQSIFRGFLTGKGDPELGEELRATSFAAGSQSLIFSAGSAGGVLVPQQFAAQVAEAQAAVDPLLDEEIVTVIKEENFGLKPLQIPGWDLSSIAAQKISETNQQNPQVIPSLNAPLLNHFTYRVTLAGSFEFENDSRAYDTAEKALARAIGVAIARGAGADLVNGDGSTGPQGILTGAVDSGVTTAAAGLLSLDDFVNIFFSVNKVYREAPKAAWLVADATLKKIRNAKDSSNRPLIDLDEDNPKICGKPVYVCPSLPSAAGSKGIIFGDLSFYYVHASAPYIKRRIQYPGLVEFGKVAWTGLQQIDAVVDDPSGGANSPIKYATLHV